MKSMTSRSRLVRQRDGLEVVAATWEWQSREGDQRRDAADNILYLHHKT